MKLKNVIKESSLSRLYSHNEKHDCGAMTAFRDAADCGEGEKYSSSDNKKRNISLSAKLKVMGYGLTKLSGTYPEGGKSKKEDSFYVVDLEDIGTLKKDLAKLGAEFEQDSILFIPKGSINGDAKAYLLGTNSCENNWLGKGRKELFHGGKMGKTSKIYTSKVNGRPFIFENVLSEVKSPGSGMGVWALNMCANKHWSNIEIEGVDY
tara:strand:+ start:711 stop:1331 length:621 start_codon:yes stop_codon:yes gene_type:complete